MVTSGPPPGNLPKWRAIILVLLPFLSFGGVNAARGGPNLDRAYWRKVLVAVSLTVGDVPVEARDSDTNTYTGRGALFFRRLRCHKTVQWERTNETDRARS